MWRSAGFKSEHHERHRALGADRKLLAKIFSEDAFAYNADQAIGKIA